MMPKLIKTKFMILATHHENLRLGQVAPTNKSAYMATSVLLTQGRLFPLPPSFPVVATSLTAEPA